MSELRVNRITTTDGLFSLEVDKLNYNTAVDIPDLQAASIPTSLTIYLQSRDGTNPASGGFFEFRSGDYSAEVFADTREGVYIAPGTDLSGSTGAWVRVDAEKGGVYPDWFGAVGDGVADDTDAVKAAIAANRTVRLFPDKTYRITAPLVLPEGTKLIGPNPVAHVGVQWDSVLNDFILPEGMSAIAVDFGAGGSGVTNAAIAMQPKCVVKGISFYYPSQSMFTENTTIDTYPATISLDQDWYPDSLSSIESVTVEDCHFCNPWQAINWSTRHALGVIKHCTGYAWDNFIYIDESYDVERIIECQMNATLAYIGDYGPDNMYGYQGSLPDSASIRIGKADACRITGTFAYGFYKGLHIDKFGTGYPNGVYIVGGGWEGSVNPLWAIKAQGLYVHAVMFGADTIGTDPGQPYSTMPLAEHAITLSGEELDKGRSIVFNACTVWTARWSALDANWIDGLTVSGCTFSDSNKFDRGFVTGVVGINNCERVTVTDSWLDQNTGNPNGQYLNVANSSGIMFQDNQHRGSSYLDGWFIGNSNGGFVGTLLERNSGGGSRLITTSSSTNFTIGSVIQW